MKDVYECGPYGLFVLEHRNVRPDKSDYIVACSFIIYKF